MVCRFPPFYRLSVAVGCFDTYVYVCVYVCQDNSESRPVSVKSSVRIDVGTKKAWVTFGVMDLNPDRRYR